MSEILEARRKDNQKRLERLRQDLLSAEEMAGDSACVYLTGSFARGEASGHRDLDLFIVGRGARGQRKLPRLDEICIKADLIETTRKHGRLEQLAGERRDSSTKNHVDAVLQLYERFLLDTDKEEPRLVAEFLDRDQARTYAQNANRLGDKVYELMSSVGETSPFFRLLVV
jgi:predicted nucleotidyltransferase